MDTNDITFLYRTTYRVRYYRKFHCSKTDRISKYLENLFEFDEIKIDKK